MNPHSRTKTRESGVPRPTGLEPVRGPEQKADIIAAFMSRMEEHIHRREFKASIADFVRLLQVQRQVDDGGVREVTVKWVGQSEGVDVYKP